MKNNIKLPFDINVYSKMYQHLAFPLGIIMGSAHKDITPWLISRHINCRYCESYPRSKFNIAIDDYWNIKENLFFKQFMVLEAKTYESLEMDFVKIFRNMILQGYYPFGNYNEQFIPKKTSYKKEYFVHDFLLIGFNDEKHCFLSVGYLNDNKFQEYEIPYECMKKAIQSLNVPKITLSFFEYNANFEYDLNIKKIKNNLCDYFKSTSYIPKREGRYFGIQAIEQVICDFKHALAYKSKMDIRYARGFMEHKFFLKLCCDYLMDNGYIKDPKVCEGSQAAYNLAQKVQLLTLKYNISVKEEIGKRVINIMYDILKIEKNYIPILIKELENFD